MSETNTSLSQVQVEMGALTDKVTAENTEIDSAILVIDGIGGVVNAAVTDALTKAGMDGTAILAAAKAAEDSVSAETDKLKQALAANTPSVDHPAIPPVVAPADPVAQPAAPTAPEITTTTLPDATVGEAYSATLTIGVNTDGSPVTFAFDPPSANGLTGVVDGSITGTPTDVSAVNFLVTASNSTGAGTPKALSITVVSAA